MEFLLILVVIVDSRTSETSHSVLNKYSTNTRFSSPFGYSIFQAVDWGKIPILAHDWLPDYDYPFRAQSPEEFKEQYEKICKLSLQEKRDILFPLREHLKQWDNKEQWRDRLLEIYNK